MLEPKETLFDGEVEDFEDEIVEEEEENVEDIEKEEYEEKGSDEGEPLNKDELRMYGLHELDEEEARKILPHVKKVASNFNRMHQKVVERLKLYEDLGEPEEVERAVELLELAAENPRDFIGTMLEFGAITEEEYDELIEEVERIEAEEGTQEEVEAQLDEAEVEESEEEVAAQREEIIEKLVKGIEGLKRKYGEFDERLILPYLDENLDFEEAYKQMVRAIYETTGLIRTASAPSIPQRAPRGTEVRTPKDLNEAKKAAYEYLRSLTQG